MAGSALKLVGVLVLINRYPFFLGVLIITSIVRLYYYLSIFINSVVRVGVGSYRLYGKLCVRNHIIFIIIFIVILN